MKSFLVIYHAPKEAIQQMSKATYEEIVEATKPWMEWKNNNEAIIESFGSRLSNGQEKSANQNWTASEKDVTGYSILKGESIDDIKSKLEYHPQLAWNPDCKVGIYEFYGV